MLTTCCYVISNTFQSMSDFGAMISITKKDKTAFSEEEFTKIEQIVRYYKENCRYTNSVGDPFHFGVGKTQAPEDPVFSEVNILLSEYWGDTEMFTWHKEPDLKDAQLILNELKPSFPEDYLVRTYFEWW